MSRSDTAGLSGGHRQAVPRPRLSLQHLGETGQEDTSPTEYVTVASALPVQTMKVVVELNRDK